MWGIPPGMKEPWPALTVTEAHPGARSSTTSPDFTTEYSGPGWVCHPVVAPGSMVTCWMWKSLGLERWMLMSSVTFPTASSLRLMFPDAGVAMAALTPARLTTPQASATSPAGCFTLICMVRPSPGAHSPGTRNPSLRPATVAFRTPVGAPRRLQPFTSIGGGFAMTVHERPFGRYFEDFEVGDVYRHWPGKTITEADDHLFCMITMNHHPLHIDAWYAEQATQFGKNVVVGNLVYSLVLGMSVPDVSGACIANLEVETLQHKRPTFHGDTIYAETRVLEKRESSSRPDRGVVTVETRGFNQRGEEVCYFRRKVMVPKRDGAPARVRPYTSPTE